MSISSPTAPNTTQAPDDRSRWVALIVLCVGMLMIVLDVTVVNVALPSIQEDLGFSQSSLAWVVNAYLIAFGGLLLLAGRLGDLISRRGVFLAGLAIFTLASIACGMAQTQEMLVAARFVQGVGGALTSAVILGMIVTMFPEPREQAKAIGVYGFVASAGGSIGLLVGGVLTQSINWHWIFFVNIPIGILTAVLAMRLLEKDRGLGLGRGTDVLGAVLITSALMLLVYTIVDPAAELGWGAQRTLALVAVSLALIVAFLVREATASNALIPLRGLVTARGQPRQLLAAGRVELGHRGGEVRERDVAVLGDERTDLRAGARVGVLAPRTDRPVQMGLAVALAREHALGSQPAHDRHHGGVRAFAPGPRVDLVQHGPDRHRRRQVPHDVHHLGLKLVQGGQLCGVVAHVRCSVVDARAVGEGQLRPKRRSRSELLTTLTELNAIAALAMIGLRIPAAASGIAATL